MDNEFKRFGYIIGSCHRPILYVFEDPMPVAPGNISRLLMVPKLLWLAVPDVFTGRSQRHQGGSNNGVDTRPVAAGGQVPRKLDVSSGSSFGSI